MRGKKSRKIRIWPAPTVYSIIFFVWMMVWFAGYFELSVLFTAVAAVFLFLLSDIREMQRPAVLLVTGYVLVSGISIIWAVSGKFFLREFSKIFFAETVLFLVIFCGKKTEEFGKQVLQVLAEAAALFGLFSVEAASTGGVRAFLEQFSAFRGTFLWFEPGTRLTGIFGNANVLASILAFGVIFSVMLLYSAKEKREKLLFAVYSGITSYAFLLCFSMGATACFLVSMILYLVFAGEKRGEVLVRMVIIAVPALVFGFLSFPCFERDGIFHVIPLVLLTADIAVIFFLETKVSEQILGWLERYRKVLPWVFGGIFAAGVVFLVAAYHLSVPYTFGKILYRSAYPDAGQHRLAVQTDADVTVQIEAQTRAQTMMHKKTEIYNGPAKDAEFTVPEGSVVCYFTFSAESGTRLKSVSVDGKEKIRLRYLLLPGSIANRLQGLWANQNFIQRLVFHRDGIRLFMRHPLLGNGVGSFEAAVLSVQDFHYETKYVHNHYIQILVETGVAGVAFYIIAMFRLLFLLIRKRKTALMEYGVVYPALAASFFMVLFHSVVEVSMSLSAFLCMAYVVFGLISLFFEEPLFGREESTETQKNGRKNAGRRDGRKSVVSLGLRIMGCAFYIIFALTLIGNLYAGFIMQDSVDQGEVFLERTGEAVSLDIYEKNDYKVSYLYCVADAQDTKHLGKANQYAKELLKVQSNSIPESLVYFYLKTGQFDKAVKAAMKGAVYSASDERVWNYCAGLFRDVFGDAENSPLLGYGNVLIPLLSRYISMWEERNQTAMEPIELEQGSMDFFSKVKKLAKGEKSVERIQKILAGGKDVG